MKEDLSITDNNFEEEVINSTEPVLVDFWASWCVPSQMMIPVLDNLSKELDGKIKIRKLNVDQNPKIRNKYKISGCPTLIIFKDGKELKRLIGAHSENQILEVLNSIL